MQQQHQGHKGSSSDSGQSKREWFDLLIEQHDDGIMAFESVRDASGLIVDFRWLYANEQAAAIVGKPSDWFEGRLLLEEMPENRDSGLFDNYVLVVETGEPSALSFTYPINGEERYFQNRSTRINDGFVVNFSDKTQERLLEQALIEDQDRLLTSLDAAQASAFDWNLITDEVTWRTGDYRVLGLPMGEEPKSLAAWQEYVHPDDREKLANDIEQAIERKDRFMSEYRVIWTDGSVHWLFGVGSVKADRGRATRIYGTISDITILKEAELENQASQNLFRSFANAIPQLAWVASKAGHNTWFNEQWYKFTGTAVGPKSGHSWLDCVEPAEIDKVAAQWQHAILTGEEVEITHQILHASGQYKPFLTRARPVLDASGEPTRWVGTSTEISDIYRTRQLLEDADREKDKFLATLAHELRNPLAPIRNTIELLSAHGNSATDITQTTAMLKRQVNQMVRLVDDLLDINRIKLGRISLQNEPVRLQSVIDESLENLKPIADEMGHTLRVETPDQLPVIVGDHLRLVQALSNLLSNACKYMAPGGLIELTTEIASGEVRILVRDHGVGLTQADLDRIFEMFAQADAAGMRSDGLGIGLALSKSLIEQHGGRLTANSLGPDLGSQFSVYLPILGDGSNEDSSPKSKEIPPASDPTTATKSILVVDDNFDAADSLAWILQAEGHTVQVAASGEEALGCLSQGLVDTVILDIGLPDISGHEVARKIRLRDDGARYKLIALTGWGQPSDREKSTEAGFDAHLVKPADLSALRQLIIAP